MLSYFGFTWLVHPEEAALSLIKEPINFATYTPTRKCTHTLRSSCLALLPPSKAEEANILNKSHRWLASPRGITALRQMAGETVKLKGDSTNNDAELLLLGKSHSAVCSASAP